LPKTSKSLQSIISREPRKHRTSKAVIRAHREGERERERVLRRESDVGRMASAKNIRAPRYVRVSDRIPSTSWPKEGPTTSIAAKSWSSSSKSRIIVAFRALGKKRGREREREREREILFDKSVVGGGVCD
jgi:hypothetical protein